MSEQEQRETVAPRTVRVRIAVVMGTEGHWAAYGWGTGHKLKQSSTVTMETALEINSEYGGVEHWIEADVPLPQKPQTIRGEVVQ